MASMQVGRNSQKRLKRLGQEHITIIRKGKKGKVITNEAEETIEKRGEAIAKHHWEERGKINKELKQYIRKDISEYTCNSVNNYLDVRDMWMGIRKTKRKYTPIPYTF